MSTEGIGQRCALDRVKIMFSCEKYITIFSGNKIKILQLGGLTNNISKANTFKQSTQKSSNLHDTEKNFSLKWGKQPPAFG